MLVVGVTSFRERELILGLFGGECVCFDLVGCDLVKKRERESERESPHAGPCLPFYSSQGEGSGFSHGKKVK
jgi:hypothetical protein